MTKFLVAFATAVLGAVCLTASAAAFSNLQPGVPKADLDEQVPVNVVFVGIEPSEVGASAFLGGLPERYKPIVRSRLFYGTTEELGIDYRYDYSVTYASASWENAFFAALKSRAEPAARTLFQDDYNAQDGTRDVGQNHFIDAPSIEKWLIDHRPSGVNTRRNTIFFIDWWGRSDFIDHVYTKFGEPDPDTGYDFGVNRQTRKIIAWGGTTPDDEETGLGRRRGENRVWFFDLSAGPEAWGSNHDITNADVDGDAVPDYRIPVSWEYAADGYRDPAALAGDLSLMARYGAINLLFTSSPLYPPYLTPPLLPDEIDLDINTYEGWPGVNASREYQKPRLVRDELEELIPLEFDSDHQDVAFTGEARNCYELWLEGEECYPDRPYPAFANLFLYNALNLDEFLDQSMRRAKTSRRYEAPLFNYATTDDLASGFLGFADDNYVDGTQSLVFNFVSQGVVDAGYGLSTTQIHETGHHLGMSHPHDGFDWETGLDYGPSGPFYFAWVPDESNSMMSYIDLNWDFSQFDRDNALRFWAAGYIKWANLIAEEILDSRNWRRATSQLSAADRAIGRAEDAIEDHDYEETHEKAVDAYEHVLRGADRADVDVEATFGGWSVYPVGESEAGSRNAILEYGADKLQRHRRAMP